MGDKPDNTDRHALARRECLQIIKAHVGLAKEAATDIEAIDFAVGSLAASLTGGCIICQAGTFRRMIFGHTAKLLAGVSGRETAINPDGPIIFADEAESGHGTRHGPSLH